MCSGDKNKKPHKSAKDASTSAPTLPQEAHILDDIVKKLNYIHFLLINCVNFSTHDQNRDTRTLLTHVRGRAYTHTQMPYGHSDIHSIWPQVFVEGEAENYLPRCSQDSQDHFHMSYAAPGSLLRTEQCSAPTDPSQSKTHEGGTTNAHCSTCEKRQTRRQKIYSVPRKHLP